MNITAFLITFNCGNYLEACIRSIDGQFRRPDNFVVIDDGSTDGSPKIINSAPISFPRMEIFSPHLGIQEQRTSALRLAKDSDAIIFLDADAVYFPNYLAHLESALEENPDAGFSYCRWNWLREDGHRFAQNAPSKFDLNRLKRSNYVSMCSLVRTSAFEGFSFDPNLLRFQDWNLWLYITLIKGLTGAFVPATLFEAQLRKNGLTMQRKGSGAKSFEIIKRKYQL